MTDRAREEAAGEAALANAPLQPGEPPKDRVFYARQHVPMKWTPYKATSQQAKRGIKGRWQQRRDYGLGWENAEYPPRAGAWIEDVLNHPERVPTPPAETPADAETASLREALIDCGQQLKAANEALSASAAGTEVARLREAVKVAFSDAYLDWLAKALKRGSQPMNMKSGEFVGWQDHIANRLVAALSPAIAADAREGA